jgi:hypothetical protein
MAIPFKPIDLRMSIPKLLELLGNENGIVYSDGVPVLKIRRYDVTQATPNVTECPNNPVHDVTQRKAFVKSRGWVILDADNNPMPEW